MSDAYPLTSSSGPELRPTGLILEPVPSAAGRPGWALTELTRTTARPQHPGGPRGGVTGVEWVRPTDLAHRVSEGIITRGAEAHRAAHAWARVRLREAITPADRQRRLAPLSAFGRHGPAPVRRDGLGR